jgi:hypothetical protein
MAQHRAAAGSATEEHTMLADLLAREKRLLESPWRHSSDYLDGELSDDFTEVGKSGRVWDKASLISGLVAAASDRVIESERFTAESISARVALIRYRTRVAGEGWIERSSLWRREDDRWRVVFHQATPAEENT